MQFTVIFVFGLTNTFVRRRPFRFNAEMLYNEKLEDDGEDLVTEKGNAGTEMYAAVKGSVAAVRSMST